MNKYRDFDNYLKEYPTPDGYFGKYGGNYLDDPELIKAFNEYAEAYNTIAQSAQTSHAGIPLPEPFQPARPPADLSEA